MEILSTFIDKGKEFLKEKAKGAKSVLPSFVSDWLLPEERKGAEAKAEKVKTESEKERSGLLGEIFESFLARNFPNISKGMDILSTTGVTKRDPEIFPWQNEFETLTALSLFVPDVFLRKVTDPLAKSKYFITMVAFFNEELAKKIGTQKDPDDVINALRELHQHLSVAKAAADKATA